MPGGENHDAAFLQVTGGAAANERFGDLAHIDGAEHARMGSLFFKCILKSYAFDHRGQLTHVISRGAIDRKRFLAGAAKNISAAHHDGNLNADVADLLQFGGHPRHGLRVDAGALGSLQRFPR